MNKIDIIVAFNDVLISMSDSNKYLSIPYPDLSKYEIYTRRYNE